MVDEIDTKLLMGSGNVNSLKLLDAHRNERVVFREQIMGT